VEIVSVSVAVLLPVDESITPVGTVILAVATTLVPSAAPACTVAWMLKLRLAFGARLTVVVRFPVPLAGVQAEPPPGVQLQETPVNGAGKVPATWTFWTCAALGLVTVSV
jgi:hypothetical protein